MTSPLRDARLVEDAASGASVHSLQQVNVSVLPAVCAVYDSPTVRHVSSNGAITKTNQHYVHAHCVNGGLGHDHELHRSLLMIRKQLMQSPANGTPSPEQQQIQKYYSLSLRIWTKPQQLRHLMMSGICLDVKRLFAWMERSWSSSGLNTSHGTASKTCVARLMSNLPRGSGLRCSKPNTQFSEPSFTTTPPLWPQSQFRMRWCSVASFFWDDPQSTPLRATVHTFWMRDWSFFGLRIGLLSGPWYVPNVMLLRCRARRAERGQAADAVTCSQSRYVSAYWFKRTSPSCCQKRTTSSSHRMNCARDQEPLSCRPRTTGSCTSPVSALFLSEVAGHVTITLRKMPRLSEPGPLGTRAKHWFDFGSLAGNSD